MSAFWVGAIVGGLVGGAIGAVALGVASAPSRGELETRCNRLAEFIQQFGLDVDEVADLENLSGYAPQPAAIAAKVQTRWTS